MNGTTHLVVGVALGLAYSYHVNAPVAVASGIVVATSIGALLPDIDHENSKLGRRIYPVSWLARRILGHRGLTHSLFAIGACVAFATHTNSVYAVAVLCGVVSHIVLDMLTHQGVQLFYPMRGYWRLIPW